MNETTLHPLPDLSGVVPYDREPRRIVSLGLAGECDLLPLSEWFDRHLRGDYFFRRGHLLGLLTRRTSRVYTIWSDTVFVGVAVVYSGSLLHNLILDQDYRGLGIGEAVLLHLRPVAVRVKTNMSDGDPMAFYAKNGYSATSRDPHRPHIVTAVRPQQEHVETSVSTGAPLMQHRSVNPPAEPAARSPGAVTTSPHLEIPDQIYPQQAPQYVSAQDAADAQRWREHRQRVQSRGRARTERRRLESAIYSQQTYPVPVQHSNGYTQQIHPPESDHG